MSEPAAITPPSAPSEVFDVSEEKLAEKIGMPRKTVSKARLDALEKGADWSRLGNLVVLSRQGLRKLLEHLGVLDAADVEDLHKHAAINGTAAQDAAAPAHAIITRFFLNPHLLEARLDTGEKIRVRVRRHKNFKPGMAIPVLPEPEGEIYRLTRKEPRFYGRW